MAYQDLREFVRALEKNNELKRILRRSGPAARDHRICRPRGETGRTGAAVRTAQGLHDSGADQRFASMRKMEIALEVKSVEEVAARIVEFLEMRMPGGPDRQAEDAAQTGRDGRVLSEDRVQGAVSGSGAPRTVSRCSIFRCCKCWPGRWRPLHHPAAGVLAQSGYGQAQLRHVPHAGVRRAHGGHALADPQAGRGALPPHAVQGRTAHGRGGGDRRRPGHHVLGDSAPAAGPGRDDDLRLPARRVRSRW